MHRDVTGGVLGGQLGDEGAGKLVTVGCLGGAEPQQQIPLPPTLPVKGSPRQLHRSLCVQEQREVSGVEMGI